MRHFATATILLAGLMSSAAYAQDTGATDDTGFYVGLSAGLASVDDTDVRYYDVGGTFGGSGTTDSAQGHVGLKNAPEFKGVVGYDFGTIRSDVEIAYSRSKVASLTLDSVNGATTTISPADAADICLYLEVSGCSVSGNTISYDDGGRIRQLSALANVWIDIPVGGTITPYLGGGVGVAGFEIDGEGKARFAWQLGAGVAFNLSDHVALTADFRHREANGANLPYDASSGVDVGKVRTNTVSAGLRFKF